MTTLFQSTTEPPTNQSAADFEPDEQWKSRLKVDIEDNLRSMVDEAKQNLHDTLKKAPVSAVERERLTEEHLATMKNIRNLAEEQFRIALERERQERRWAAGQVLDQEWSDTMIKEQQAILDKIERERKDKAAAHSSSSSQPIADPSLSHSSRSPERVWTPHEHNEFEHEADYFHRAPSREFEEDHVPPPRDTGKARAGSVSSVVGSYKPPSTLDTTDRAFERSKPSPTIDELDDMPRSARSPTDAQDSIRRGSLRRKTSISIRQLPEFWHPSITPEQDAQMSRTFSMARRGSTASTTSSYRAPSVLNIPFSSEPHDTMLERERERISAIEQEWIPMDRARDRERTTSYTYAEARAGVTTPQRLDDRYPASLSSVTPISSAISYTRPVESPSSAVPIAYSRPADSPISAGYTRSSDSTRPPPSASRPIATKKSLTFDDGGFQSSPSPKGWTGPSRSPYDTRYETSRSPQTPEEIPRSWQSSNLRARLSSQDMRYGYNAGEGYYAARPVHTHHEVSEGEYDVDLDDADWREYDERQMRQREDSVNLRRREEEVARREQELRRREEDAKREEEARLKEEELKRKEEETKRKEEETRRKEDEIRRKEVEARRRQEEADRKELEVRRMEEEARKKEEETKRKEDEIQRKEMLARKKEEEVRRQEAQARKRADDLRKQEEEVARRLEEEERRVALEISRKSMEAKRKEDEVKRKEEDARLKEEAARAKEEEIQRKEEELLRREEELLRREAEAIRRSDDKQKVQQDEFRKREEEIRRQRAEEKRKQEKFEWESWGSYYPSEPSRPTPPPQMASSHSQSSSSPIGPWPIPNRNDRSMPGPTTDRSSFGSAAWTSSTRPSSTASSQPPSTPKPPTSSAQTSRPTPPPQMASSHSQSSSSSTGPWPIPNRSDRSTPGPTTDRSSFGSAAWMSSTRPSSTASSQPPSTPKPPTPPAQQNAKAAPGPPPTPFSEAEFHRRQAEQAQQREEQFRREQAKLEHERLLKAGKALGKQDTIKLFEHHRGQWSKLQMSRVLIWDNFPWPVFKRPNGPDDITTRDITAYMLSSLHPIDKSLRHHVKENIKWWHHDRFEIWLLPKVRESDRDGVREAASTVARTLYHLLRFGTQDPDASTASSCIIILKSPILLAQQSTNTSSQPAHPPISEAKTHRGEVEQACQGEEQFHLEPVKLGQEKEILHEEQLAREEECNNLKLQTIQSQTVLLPNIPTPPSPKTTAAVEEASQELPDFVSNSLEDLTRELQRTTSFPTACGGFGDIWKCILVKDNGNVDVAVKTIRVSEADNEALIRKTAKRVRRELKVWGRLKHQSILPLWGVTYDFGPYPAMICPWAKNGALTGFLERQQNMLSSLDKFSLLNDIALGLQYLHSKSVIHGDLTGSNVLIDGNGRACLADFGLSTIILEFIGTSYFTSSDRGNVRWVAAELFEDEEVSLSPECDIYSFGSITLQVLTCRIPYYNMKRDITVIGQVAKGLKPKPPKESKIVPKHWEFIQRCWLPRASRPPVAEIVTFIACEQQALSP